MIEKVKEDCNSKRRLLKKHFYDQYLGQVFSDLTVLRFAYINKSNFYYYVKCSCGVEKVLYIENVIKNHTKSCGHRLHQEVPYKDLTNQKFNKLTALRYAQKSRWLCVCDCGKEREVATQSLLSGKQKSCGCYNLERLNQEFLAKNIIIDNIEHKQCSVCNDFKIKENNYVKDSSKRDGRRPTCKDCDKKFHKEQFLNFDRTPKVSEKCCRACKLIKPAIEFGLRAGNKDGLKGYCKDCAYGDFREYSKTDAGREKDKIRRRRPHVKIAITLRSRIAKAIKAQLVKKNNKTMELTGCSVEFLKTYLEHLFKPGMTWENHGLGDDKWHLDHIRPCASFDLTDPEQQKQCFHYTNLQPLWQSENLAKKDKWNPEGDPCLI